MDFGRATELALDSLGYFVPELILSAAILLVILADLFVGRGKALSGDAPGVAARIPGFVAVAGLLASVLAALPLFHTEPRTIFFGMLAVDSMAAFFKALFGLSTTLIILVGFRLRHQGELCALLLTVVLGMNLLAASRNFLMIAVSLELVSVMSYVLAGFDRRDTRSGEAALKYMLFGAMSSGAMLYGISLLYGITGTLDLVGIQGALQQGGEPLTVFVALLLILAGIGYKIAMVPFHFWCPDVYEGAPTPVTTFFSVGPKAAGLALLARFLYPSMQGDPLLLSIPVGEFSPVLLVAILSAFTMTLGNFAAIGQRHVKRLLAYSSIAHAGYLMMALVLANGDGLHALLFYLVLYFFMNYGAFLLVDGVGLISKGDETLDAFRGLGRRHPVMAFAMTVFLVSLIGLPPLAGFIGKYVLFAAVIDAGWYWLVTVAILNSVVSLYYYFAIVKAMYFESSEESEAGPELPAAHTGIIAGLCALTILLGIYWEPLIRFTRGSVAHLL